MATGYVMRVPMHGIFEIYPVTSFDLRCQSGSYICCIRRMFFVAMHGHSKYLRKVASYNGSYNVSVMYG